MNTTLGLFYCLEKTPTISSMSVTLMLSIVASLLVYKCHLISAMLQPPVGVLEDFEEDSNSMFVDLERNPGENPSSVIQVIQQNPSSVNRIVQSCCEAETRMQNFSTLPDQFGRQLRLVQLAGRQQYFPVDTCRSFSNCNCPCACALTEQSFTALTYDPDTPSRIVFNFVTIPSVCRCVNNFRRHFEDQYFPYPEESNLGDRP
ncbi:uncharacterized protein LOC129925033 [Biomphalaria glabrata]|uniref:Uncharacterized protein LOC129925033 n=1 Tax=Biomphalaria glabrata TaxID=6526 RepID=A0A9W2ZVS0_BIOGL|nr:uncharacterized protein LOC129925033 [Biomphalaria glabrata]